MNADAVQAAAEELLASWKVGADSPSQDMAGHAAQRDAATAVAAAEPIIRAEIEAERRKFQAETRVSWFLSERLRSALGAATRCDRCHTARGSLVARSEDASRVEWVCDACVNGNRADVPVLLGGAS